MAKIAIADAAFTGLRVIRRNPGAVIAWALLHLISVVGISALVLLKFGGALAQLQASKASLAGSDSGNAQVLATKLAPEIHQVLPLYGYIILIALVLYSIFVCAMNRAVLRPRDSGAGFLRLGLDEFRQLVVTIAYAFIGLAIQILLVAVAVAVFLGVRAGLRVAAPHAPNFIPFLLAFLVFIVSLVVINVRLSLASAQTFATKSIDLFGSWRLTRGQFWPIFATYLLTFVVYIVVAVVLAIIIGLIQMGVAAAGLGHMNMVHFTPIPLHGVGGHKVMVTTNLSSLPPGALQVKDWRGLLALATPLMVIQTVVNAIMMAIIMPILLTPPAAILKALTAESAPSRAYNPLNMS